MPNPEDARRDVRQGRHDRPALPPEDENLSLDDLDDDDYEDETTASSTKKGPADSRKPSKRTLGVKLSVQELELEARALLKRAARRVIPRSAYNRDERLRAKLLECAFNCQVVVERQDRCHNVFAEERGAN